MVAEYRALRATVLRLWLKNNSGYTKEDSGDIIRFNEAIDQALAESVEHYAELAIESQDIFRHVVAGNCRGNWDGRRIGQVCQNLIGNALQYSASDSAIEMTLQGNESDVVLSVRNHGLSIPDTEQKNLFDPLRRHVSNKSGELSVNKNLGLGLYIAKEVVTAHHGTIGFKSTEAEGTTFTVALPKSSNREAGKLLSRSNG